MKYKSLKELNEEIQKKEKCSNDSLPVINELKPSQRYLIISSDPSSDTDKSKDELEKHSGFEERVSRNWNKQHREEYKFYETWALIRSKLKLN